MPGLAGALNRGMWTGPQPLPPRRLSVHEDGPVPARRTRRRSTGFSAADEDDASPMGAWSVIGQDGRGGPLVRSEGPTGSGFASVMSMMSMPDASGARESSQRTLPQPDVEHVDDDDNSRTGRPQDVESTAKADEGPRKEQSQADEDDSLQLEVPAHAHQSADEDHEAGAKGDDPPCENEKDEFATSVGAALAASLFDGARSGQSSHCSTPRFRPKKTVAAGHHHSPSKSSQSGNPLSQDDDSPARSQRGQYSVSNIAVAATSGRRKASASCGERDEFAASTSVGAALAASLFDGARSGQSSHCSTPRHRPAPPAAEPKVKREPAVKPESVSSSKPGSVGAALLGAAYHTPRSAPLAHPPAAAMPPLESEAADAGTQPKDGGNESSPDSEPNLDRINTWTPRESAEALTPRSARGGPPIPEQSSKVAVSSASSQEGSNGSRRTSSCRTPPPDPVDPKDESPVDGGPAPLGSVPQTAATPAHGLPPARDDHGGSCDPSPAALRPDSGYAELPLGFCRTQPKHSPPRYPIEMTVEEFLHTEVEPGTVFDQWRLHYLREETSLRKEIRKDEVRVWDDLIFNVGVEWNDVRLGGKATHLATVTDDAPADIADAAQQDRPFITTAPVVAAGSYGFSPTPAVVPEGQRPPITASVLPAITGAAVSPSPPRYHSADGEPQPQQSPAKHSSQARAGSARGGGHCHLPSVSSVPVSPRLGKIVPVLGASPPMADHGGLRGSQTARLRALSPSTSMDRPGTTDSIGAGGGALTSRAPSAVDGWQHRFIPSAPPSRSAVRSHYADEERGTYAAATPKALPMVRHQYRSVAATRPAPVYSIDEEFGPGSVLPPRQRAQDPTFRRRVPNTPGSTIDDATATAGQPSHSHAADAAGSHGGGVSTSPSPSPMPPHEDQSRQAGVAPAATNSTPPPEGACVAVHGVFTSMAALGRPRVPKEGRLLQAGVDYANVEGYGTVVAPRAVTPYIGQGRLDVPGQALYDQRRRCGNVRPHAGDDGPDVALFGIGPQPSVITGTSAACERSQYRQLPQHSDSREVAAIAAQRREAAALRTAAESTAAAASVVTLAAARVNDRTRKFTTGARLLDGKETRARNAAVSEERTWWQTLLSTEVLERTALTRRLK